MGETPEEKAASLDAQFEESQRRAAEHGLGQPAQLPTNPLTGDDSADDGASAAGQ